MPYTWSPPGHTADFAQPGDFILCHRKGLVSSIIRAGERLRGMSGSHWSHAAFVERPGMLIEALTHGVTRTPLKAYKDTEYVVVHTALDPLDAQQAVAFARSCLGQHYGFGTILGIAISYLTPFRGLWFGMNGTEICSGLVAQAECRGWANFPVNPATVSPLGLARAYHAPERAALNY